MHPPRLRRPLLLALLAFAALVLFAEAPLLAAGLMPSDYAVLLGAQGAAGTCARLAMGLLGLPRPGEVALAWRLEALLALVGCALAGQRFLARALAPWIGDHPARAAAWASALLFPLHPACTATVAGLASAAELHALLLGLSASALFLSGRQEERELRTVLACLLLFAAGWFSGRAILFALALVVAEYASVRRHRRARLRARTAATTFAVFVGAAAVPWLFRVHVDAAAAEPGSYGALGAGRNGVQVLLRELGRVAAPSSEATGSLGTLVAGALLLLALQPAFRAARNAPRLWGGLLVVWVTALFGALLWASASASGGALLAAWVLCAGLGATITALVRPWRALLVVAVSLGWAILAHLGARPWNALARELARFHGELAALAVPAEASLLVLDPPEVPGAGSDARDIGWLWHPRLAAEPAPGPFDARRVRALSSAAFLAFVPTEEFRSLRASGLWVARRRSGASGLEAVALPPPSAPPTTLTWSLKLYFDVPSEEPPLDPLATDGARVVAELATPGAQLQLLQWTAPGGAQGSVAGWLGERAGRRVAEFDLASSLEWRLAGGVRHLVLESGVNDIERGEVVLRLPEVGGLGPPELQAHDWVFPLHASGAPEVGGSYALVLLSLRDLEALELPLENEREGLRARGTERFMSEVGGAPLAWAVEYRIGAHVLARTRGRFP